MAPTVHNKAEEAMTRRLDKVTLDVFAQSNPGLCAACICWLSEGYAERIRKDKQERERAMPILLGIIGLALLIPDSIRAQLPRTAHGKLPLLMLRHPEWKAVFADAIRASVQPFWNALRFASAHRAVTIEGARIRIGEKIKEPATDFQRALRQQSRVVGSMLARAGEGELAIMFGIRVMR